jgi:hypothetical protein
MVNCGNSQIKRFLSPLVFFLVHSGSLQNQTPKGTISNDDALGRDSRRYRLDDYFFHPLRPAAGRTSGARIAKVADGKRITLMHSLCRITAFLISRF